MASDELTITIREFAGVDLADNARVSNPYAFRKLTNVYHEQPGKLTKRPGSMLFAQKIVVGSNVENTSSVQTQMQLPDTIFVPRDPPKNLSIINVTPSQQVGPVRPALATVIAAYRPPAASTPVSRFVAPTFRSVLFNHFGI